MVTVLSCIPILPAELKVTLMVLLSPFLTGSLGHSGTVHPHEPEALVIINGSLPELTKVKMWVTLFPCLMVPKLYSSSSNLNSGAFLFSVAGGAVMLTGVTLLSCPYASAPESTNAAIKNFDFIFVLFGGVKIIWIY